ncbi:hypothetical protein M413DRAFT_25747 [Hebeloma cylindrosporum]|uniref:Aminoglycoside phosphotransferase domain-containing protein n=1 Tax=Hebeloma cylindrosporum TaxID=76867 RepID=A0A0C3CKL0_HEBCY|nr:hypothetical protein M413DRAFT_25747 [Hebeloma cylindrosporum h7]
MATKFATSTLKMEPHDILLNPENADFDLDVIIGKFKEIDGSDIIALHKLAQNHYFVFDASTKDGRHYIVRIGFCKTNFGATVHYYNASHAAPYIITDKCKGNLLIDAFGILPFEAKISNIRSYARIALDLFRVDAPNGIGSISSFKSTADGSELVLGPYILPSVAYFRQMTSTSVGTTKPDLDEAQVSLKRLESLISQSVSGYNDAAFLRGVPSHQDFCAQNVFINGEGLITGPQVSSTGSSTWSNRLCWPQPIHLGFAMMESLTLEEYDAIVKEEDPEYYRALKAGEFCRMAEEWLLNERMDIGCRRMKAWLDNSLE